MTRARGWALALLIAALAGGAYLRFAALDAIELSADEAASWTAASAPSAAAVVRLQAHLNPGELGLHDLALHWWIEAFGDGVATMRALSAVFGVVAIAMLFLVMRALLSFDQTPSTEEHGDPWTENDLIAALAALLFAVNLVSIKYSREARMYPLALTLTLAQVWFFLRALRTTGLGALAGVALFTAAAIATNFTTLLILIPEAIYLAISSRVERRTATTRILRLGAAVAAGFVLLAPLAALYLHNRGGAPNPDTWSWIAKPAPWAAFALFNKGTGTYAFPLFAILAFSGAIRAWPERRSAVLFLLLWMLTPPLALTLASYLFHPVFVERYLLSCFAPFFALAAFGIVKLKPAAFRPGALALVTALALAHVQSWRQKPHGDAWAEATAIAAANVKPGGAVGVAPRYAGNVVRYYLERAHSPVQVAALDGHPAPDVVIVADSFDGSAIAPRDYPHVLAHPRGLTVRAR